jgi:hypothetical protein
LAGMFPAGFGPAGVTPVYVSIPAAPLTPPRAIFYDPSIKQYSLTDNLGNLFDVDPVDQIVATRATTEQGQSASNPSLGQRIRARWRYAQPAQKLAIAQQEIATEFADLVKAGDMIILSVVLKTNANNANVVVFSYKNLANRVVSPPGLPQAGGGGIPITVTP